MCSRLTGVPGSTQVQPPPARQDAARPRLVDLLASTRFPRRPTPLRTSDLASEAGALARRLRRHKQVEVLRIALRDLSGASIPEVTRDLSRLAARAFEAAVRFHYRRLCARSEEHTSELQSRLHLVC